MPTNTQSPATGMINLTWKAQHQLTSRRWLIVGQHPGDDAWMSFLPVAFVPPDVCPEAFARAVAQLLNDLPAGAGALMLADLLVQADQRRHLTLVGGPWEPPA